MAKKPTTKKPTPHEKALEQARVDTTYWRTAYDNEVAERRRVSDIHATTKQALESAQATMHFLAERLVIAEKAVAQRRDEGMFSPGMSDVEMQALVQVATSMSVYGPNPRAMMTKIGMPYETYGATGRQSDAPSSGFGNRVLQALEAEFVRRGIVDAADAVQGTVDASQSMLVAEFERGVEAAVLTGHNADGRDVERTRRLVRLKERERLGGHVTEEEWEAAYDDEPYPGGEAPTPSTEEERVALYQELTARGLSDAEARGTAWPEEKEVPNAEVPGGGEAVAGEGEEAPG